MSDPALERTPMTNDAERVRDIVARLRARTVRVLPKDWQEGRNCPECDIGANRPKCMWDMGGGCPRHDPDNYEPSPYIVKPDPTSTAAADIIEAQSKALAEAREALKPFADFAEKAEQFVADRAKDGASPVMPSTDFRLADFRRARAALTPTPENPNG